MSNTLIIDSLNTLFSMSNTAVLGAQEQFVAFMNPAAQELFRGDRTNHKLSELLPAHITEATATEFVTSATIEKRHVIISVTSFGAFRLFSLVPQDENALRAGAQFAPFLASLNAFRALTTYFSDYAMQLSDVRFRRNAAELTQFYYRLLRFTLNASTASGLYDGTLAFMPQLCDLGKECRTLLDNIQSITDANGIVLEVIIPDEPINCALDTALIQRMLLNIIANCTERCKHGDRIRFTVTQDGDHADITIRDDGVRIPPAKLGTIFIPLRVTGVDFSDLSSNNFGLTVALGIAEKHNGTILLEQTTADSFIVSPYDKGRLYAGESATFTVQPKAGLPAGTYDEEIFLDTSAGFFNLPVHYTSTGGGQPEYPSSWAREQVEEAVAAGLVPSFLQTKYTQAATRAEFCALAVELYETVTGTTITKILAFSDTTDINVKKMAGLGVVNGVGDGKFDPNGTLTREQAATILVRLADAMGHPLPQAGAPFADNASIGSWARDAVGRVKAGGIMDGVGSNTFNPKAAYSREQSILTILRLYQFTQS